MFSFLACSVFFSHGQRNNDYLVELPSRTMTASSERDDHRASEAAKLWQRNGWVAANPGSDQWIQTNMVNSPKIVTQIIIFDSEYDDGKVGWVSSFSASYFDRLEVEHGYVNPITGTSQFDGVTEEGVPSRVSVDPRLVYRLRVYPRTFYLQVTLRYGLLFCTRKSILVFNHKF